MHNHIWYMLTLSRIWGVAHEIVIRSVPLIMRNEKGRSLSTSGSWLTQQSATDISPRLRAYGGRYFVQSSSLWRCEWIVWIFLNGKRTWLERCNKQFSFVNGIRWTTFLSTVDTRCAARVLSLPWRRAAILHHGFPHVRATWQTQWRMKKDYARPTVFD